MKKIGFIGVGKMGLSHLAIANSLPNLEVRAMADTSTMLLKTLNKGLRVATYIDYKEMVELEELDAVVISLPNSLHFEAVKACLLKGLNVFIEKPFTLDYKQSLELQSLAEEKNLYIQVGYVNRFCDTFSYVREIINSQSLGQVTNYSSIMTGPVITENHESGWRNDYSKGGGCLNDYGPHCIDLICFLFGTEFEVTQASLQSKFSTKVDDIVDAKFTHPDFSGEIYINWSDNTVRKASNKVRIDFERGSIEVSKQEMSITSALDIPQFNIKKGDNLKYITDFSTDVSFYLRGEEFSRQLEEFSHSLNSKTSSICDLASACKVDKTIADIFSKSGK